MKGGTAVAEEIEAKLPFVVHRGDDDFPAAVVDRLAWDDPVPRDAIKVKVEKGWVTPSGEVASYYLKTAAGQEIRWLPGVVVVSDQISIKVLPDTVKLSDDISDALNRFWLCERHQRQHPRGIPQRADRAGPIFAEHTHEGHRHAVKTSLSGRRGE